MVAASLRIARERNRLASTCVLHSPSTRTSSTGRRPRDSRNGSVEIIESGDVLSILEEDEAT